MTITEDNASRFAVESSATGAWLIAGLLVLGSLGGVWYMSSQTGVVETFQLMLAGMFLVITVPLLIVASPSVALRFELGPKVVHIRLSWPLFSTSRELPFSALERVEAVKCYGRNGAISYRLALRLREGKNVWLGRMSWSDKQAIHALAARMNTLLAAAPRPTRRKA
ncbi:hypothetical protein D3C72_559520 [compost metagenome]